MALSRRWKLPIFAAVLQIIFVIIFLALSDYHGSAKPKDNTGEPFNVPDAYPFFQDVHVMIFVGFGFLMTFLKRYGFSAVGINMLLAAFCVQWAIIIRGLIHGHVTEGQKFTISVTDMLTGDFASATILISFGALLGKVGPLQLLFMALVEVALAQVNEYIGLDMLHAVDVGESMYIHAFGAYFGLAAARVLYNEEVENSDKEGSVYHSDLFAMIGTLFLWMYWPSFNGGGATGDEQHRAVINTYLSLAACTVVTYIVSGILDKHGRFDMVHIQNATLAGGVAVGTTANMPLSPGGAVVMGSLAGFISVLGYKYLTPFMASKLKIHDTCGVHNLHGMPGVFAGLGGVVMAALADYESWGDSTYEIFPAMAPAENTTDFSSQHHPLAPWGAGSARTAGTQAGYQFLALAITMGIAIVGGALTGLLLKLPIWDSLGAEDLFDDRAVFEVPEEGVPSSGMNGVHKPAKDSYNMEVNM